MSNGEQAKEMSNAPNEPKKELLRNAKGQIVKGSPQPYQPNPKSETSQTEAKNRPDCRVGRPRTWTDEKVNDLCDKFEAWLEKGDTFWLQDFLYSVDIRFSQVDHLKRMHPRFAELVIKAKEKQERVLWRMGLHDRPPSFIKWSLCAHHGYRNDPDGQQSMQELLKKTLYEVVKTMDYGKKEKDPQVDNASADIQPEGEA